VDEYGQGVVNYARRMGHRDPEEVMGATLETLARGIARFEGNHSQLRSFVYSIAHARIVDDVRKRSRRQDMGAGILEDLHVPEATDPDADGRLLAALEQLSESQRMMIHLRYVEGLSTKETARAVGKSEVATRVALSRGLSQLRDVLNGEIS
jgi:RNA polymerase sigma-70 factor (ECF subfamily)